MKLGHREVMWLAICIACFILGLWAGFVLHQQFIISGLTQIAEGLEGTNFNIEIDFNETEIVKALVNIFNETNITGG